MKFLVSRKFDVNRTLGGMELPGVGDVFCPQTKNRFLKYGPPAIQHFIESRDRTLRFTAGVLSWAEKEEIRVFWEQEAEFRAGPPDPDFEQAGRLFHDPVTRRAAGMLMLGGLGLDEVSALLVERFQVSASTKALSIYAFAYWDFRNVSPAFWVPKLQKQFSEVERKAYAEGRKWPSPSLTDFRRLLGLRVKRDLDEVLADQLDHTDACFHDEVNSLHRDSRAVVRLANSTARLVKEIRGGNKVGPKAEPARHPLEDLQLFSIVPENLPHKTLAELQEEAAARAREYK